MSLFVPQPFHRIEPGSFHGGNHSADHANHQQHAGGEKNCAHRNAEAHVAFAAGVFKERAQQRNVGNQGGNSISQDNSQRATQEHHHQGFSKELCPYVAFGGSQGPAQADFANPFVNRNQHDVHHPHAADSQGEGPDESQQHLKPDGDAIDHGTKLFAAEHLDGLLVGGGKALAVGNRRQYLGLGLLFELRRNRSKQQHRSIARVPHFAGGGERNEDGAIVAGEVIAQLQLALHDADDGKADAVNLNFFAHGRPSAKELLADAPANECHPSVFHLVSSVDPAAFG